MPQLHDVASNFYELFYQVRKTLSETTAGYWSDLEILNVLNKGQKDIAVKTRCLKKEVTVTTVASTSEYDLKDNSFSDIFDISTDGATFYVGGTTYQPLIYKTKKQLSIEFPNWQATAAGVPQYYYYDKATKTIGIWPKPNSTNAGAYLIVSGFHYPKILLAGTASSGSTTTIVFPSGSSTVPYPSTTNDYYNNLYIEIYSGTGAGQKSEITDYVASTRTATISMTTAPDNTSIFGMVPQIMEEAHGLMISYALWKLWPKGGSRTSLGNNYKQEYYQGLAEFIGDVIEDFDEEIVKDSYR